MAVQVDLVDNAVQVNNSKDSIVIIENIVSIRGGKSLNVAGFGPDVLQAGHVIIKETATGDYKPMPVTGTGAITTLGAITAGSLYEDGTYTDVPLTGGAGSGATANITVESGAVTNVELVNAGSGYAASNSLSAVNTNLGGAGSGFAVAVTAVGAFVTAYDSLPENHTYAGILNATILKRLPFAGVMTWGVVNEVASPFPVATIKAAFLTALSNRIEFRGDLS